MIRWSLKPAIGLFCLLLAQTAFAGEGMFSRAYTTETVPAGHYELEQLLRQRTKCAYGSYTAYDMKTEFEYGVTDEFQIAFYLNMEQLTAKGAPDDNLPTGTDTLNQNSFFVQSLSTEFIYRTLSPVKDPIGLAFYLEPEWDFVDMHNGLKMYDSMELEFRILFQKNFLDDQLILVYNLIFEFEYYRYGDRETPFIGELDWNNEIGLTYRVAPLWYVGLEARNHNEEGNFYSHDHSVYWAGPAVHYGGPKFWATFGVLTEVYGVPSGYATPAGADAVADYQGPGGLFLHSHEQWETTLKVAMPF